MCIYYSLWEPFQASDDGEPVLGFNPGALASGCPSDHRFFWLWQTAVIIFVSICVFSPESATPSLSRDDCGLAKGALWVLATCWHPRYKYGSTSNDAYSYSLVRPALFVSEKSPPCFKLYTGPCLDKQKSVSRTLEDRHAMESRSLSSDSGLTWVCGGNND